MDDSLLGIPFIGPVRRAALQAAGITTRAQLAQMSVEQLVGVTGMQRSMARRALDLLNPADAVAPPTLDPQPEDGSPEADRGTDLERAILRLQIVLSDATRAAAYPKLTRQFVKLAALLDVLPRRAGAALKPKEIRRVVERLGAIASRLDGLAATDFTPLKEQDKIREEVRVQRKSIEALLESARRKKK